MAHEVNGGCLCGSIRFTLSGPFDRFYFCYCLRCRKSTGSAHASNIFTTPDRIQWLSGQERVRRYELPEAERFCKSFCPDCGSPVPALSRDGKSLIIPAGSLDADPGLRPQAGIFWRVRAAWYEDGLAARRYDGYPA